MFDAAKHETGYLGRTSWRHLREQTQMVVAILYYYTVPDPTHTSTVCYGIRFFGVGETLTGIDVKLFLKVKKIQNVPLSIFEKIVMELNVNILHSTTPDEENAIHYLPKRGIHLIYHEIMESTPPLR